MPCTGENTCVRAPPMPCTGENTCARAPLLPRTYVINHVRAPLLPRTYVINHVRAPLLPHTVEFTCAGHHCCPARRNRPVQGLRGSLAGPESTLQGRRRAQSQSPHLVSLHRGGVALVDLPVAHGPRAGRRSRRTRSTARAGLEGLAQLRAQLDAARDRRRPRWLPRPQPSRPARRLVARYRGRDRARRVCPSQETRQSRSRSRPDASLVVPGASLVAPSPTSAVTRRLPSCHPGYGRAIVCVSLRVGCPFHFLRLSAVVALPVLSLTTIFPAASSSSSACLYAGSLNLFPRCSLTVL